MIEILITFISVLLATVFFTIAERKLLASIQRRKGPNVTGFWGTLQAIADGVKLILKEVVIPIRSNWVLFLAAPSITFLISMVIWVFIPFSDLNYLTNFYLFDLILLVSVVFITALIITYSISHLLNLRTFRTLINNAKNRVYYNLTKPLPITIMVFNAKSNDSAAPAPLPAPVNNLVGVNNVVVNNVVVNNVVNAPIPVPVEQAAIVVADMAPFVPMGVGLILVGGAAVIHGGLGMRIMSRNPTFNHLFNPANPNFIKILPQAPIAKNLLFRTSRSIALGATGVVGAAVGATAANQSITEINNIARTAKQWNPNKYDTESNRAKR